MRINFKFNFLMQSMQVAEEELLDEEGSEEEDTKVRNTTLTLV